MTRRRIIQSYPLSLTFGQQRVEMPIGAEVVAVESIGDSIRLFASSPVGERLTNRWFAVRTAGAQYLAEDEGRCVGVAKTHDGQVLSLVYDVTFPALARGEA